MDKICSLPDDYKNSLILGSNNNDMIEFLISNGVNINMKNFYGNRPLHIAALLSNKEGAEILISHGAEINSLNKNSQTPLDIAVMLNKKTHEDILKNNKIEMNIVRENNIDFLDSLIEDSEMEALLKSHGGKTNPNSKLTGDEDILFVYIWKRKSLEIRLPIVTIILLFLVKYLKQKITNQHILKFIQTLIYVLIGIICIDILFILNALYNVINITVLGMLMDKYQ
ncbi:hypothetical protein TVAG_388190 [Trichomonas vaginalis G3]|uniref:Uncharacterized protein n=2 Tax=Trichomonas vaginalis (strain ATCC PRA-98 / G3) TaxID=412133 RepID=A2E145_TRIV3|nr:hypothetical protein TVAG_388190 [Trichomonas vaginalis G3]|eukprot:XP_001325900.1 hypothetical protein [Trichomonas vaginalis G3]